MTKKKKNLWFGFIQSETGVLDKSNNLVLYSIYLTIFFNNNSIRYNFHILDFFFWHSKYYNIYTRIYIIIHKKKSKRSYYIPD